MGEARRRRSKDEIENYAQDLWADIRMRKCSANNIAYYCCDPEAWKHVQDVGTMGFYVYGEPLDQKVIDVAQLYGIDPHDLDSHVAGHGWESHDDGFDDAVNDAAECMIDSGYGVDRDKEKCRPE